MTEFNPAYRSADHQQGLMAFFADAEETGSMKSVASETRPENIGAASSRQDMDSTAIGIAAPPPGTLWNTITTLARADKDVKEAGDAQKGVARTVASSIAAKSGRLPALDLDPVRALSTLADAKMGRSLAATDAVMASLPPELHAAVANGLENSGEDVFRAPADGSMHEFFGELTDAIASLKKNYLGAYEEAMQKNSAFYKEFLAATDLSQWMTSSDKDVTLTLTEPGTAKISKQEIKDKARGLKNAADRGQAPDYVGLSLETIENMVAEGAFGPYRADASGLLGRLKELLKNYAPFTPVNLDSGVLVFAKDGESARKWAKDMGMPASAVVEDPNVPDGDPKKWAVTLDLAPVKDIVKVLEDMISSGKSTTDSAKKVTVTLPTAQFQAWKVGYEAQAQEIKNVATLMAQKMANAQSIYENLIKVLSNTINAIMDTLKGFLQN
jgi:hypothetical protein